MPSIKQIQGQLAAFDRAARHAESPDAIRKTWKRIFDKELSAVAAKSFSQYYKEMRSKQRKTQRGGRRTRRRTYRRGRRVQRGGVAPVNYGTVPGVLAQTYGQFPVEVDTDPSSIRDLDVYFHDSLPLSKPGYWPTVPADMGTNKVGGRRRGRKTQRRGRDRGTQRGGNLLDSLAMRPIPFISTPYPNIIQSASHNLSGITPPIPSPASPVAHTYTLQGNAGVLQNPGMVTHIGSDFSRLASPAPWQTTN